MSTKNKAKVTCAGFIMCAMTPVAIMVATFKTRKARARYVLMSFDERSALDLMADDLGRPIPDPNCPGLLDDHHGPAALRTTAFDVETGASIDETEPFNRAGSTWTNAEPLWINIDAYRPLVESLHQAWLRANLGEPGGPEARSWLAWTAIRKLNMAAEAS